MAGHEERWEGKPRRWPDPRRGPWEVKLAWSRQASGREPCVGFQLRWADPENTEPEPREVSSSLLRMVPVGTMIARQRMTMAVADAHSELILAWVQQNPNWGLEDAPPDLTDELVETARRRLQGRQGRPGRPAVRGVEFYQAVAAVYADAYRRGENPTLAITKAHKRLGVKLSRSGAAKAVAKTRRLGLLGPAEKGKAGGLLLREES